VANFHQESIMEIQTENQNNKHTVSCICRVLVQKWFSYFCNLINFVNLLYGGISVVVSISNQKH